MPKRKLPARDLAADIKSGLSYQDLLDRYSLSEAILDAACKKLIEAGLIEAREVPQKTIDIPPAEEPETREPSQLQTRVIPSFKCPHCGTVHIQGDAVCTQCGVLFDSLESSSDVPAQTEDGPRGSASECLACGAPRDPDTQLCPTCGMKAPVISSARAIPPMVIEPPTATPVRPVEKPSSPRHTRALIAVCLLGVMVASYLAWSWYAEKQRQVHYAEMRTAIEVVRERLRHGLSLMEHRQVVGTFTDKLSEFKTKIGEDNPELVRLLDKAYSALHSASKAWSNSINIDSHAKMQEIMQSGKRDMTRVGVLKHQAQENNRARQIYWSAFLDLSNRSEVLMRSKAEYKELKQKSREPDVSR